MFINLSDIPGPKNLMLDYLYEFENVEKYYLKNFRDEETIEHHLTITSERNLLHRQKLVEIIKSQYKSYSPSQLTKKNINSLLSNKTLAVVTAQQLGLFGGPLNYLYKIITAIKLTTQLKEKYEEINFVPIFWLEGEDHGLENANKIYTYTKDNQIKKVEYSGAVNPEDNLNSVGDIILGSNIDNSIDNLLSLLKKTEYTDELKNLLKNTFMEGKTFTEAFRKLLFNIFDEYGLIIFDFNMSETKSLARDIFTETVKNWEALSLLAIQRSARLEAEYHVQLKIHPVNLYIFENGRRYRLEPHEKGFRVGTKRKIISEAELNELIAKSPERLSPDVFLRPIVQDFILPTAITVAGPNEINYFPQLIPYYEYFGIESPILFPRAFVTLNETFLQKKIDLYKLKYRDIFLLDEKELTAKILSSDPTSQVGKIFDETEHEIDFTLDRLKEKLFAIDPDLSKDAKEVRDGILKLMGILRTKAESSNSSKMQAVIRHSKLLKHQFMPNNKLQEDVINFAYFANKYGLDILKLIYNEISINSFEEQIITL